MASIRMGRRIKALRTERGLSRQTLAERAAISREYVRLLEAGRYDPTVTVVRRVAKALKVKPSALID
jgi:transcriptional regulator with XRE-family HTH domain